MSRPLVLLLLGLALLTLSSKVMAIVTRHDVPEQNFLLNEQPAFLVDLPHEGHGVLIHPRWVLTVAHTVFYDYTGKVISVSGQDRKIVRVVIHAGYRLPDESILSGDSARLMEFFRSRDDIALIELDTPVTDVEPLALFTSQDEQGSRVVIMGRGATGNGRVGEIAETKGAMILRRCENRIVEARGNWLKYAFDHPDSAEPLEGMHGSGDSGGPLIIYLNGKPFLAGLSS